MRPVTFLELDDALAFHAHLVRRYGGSQGIRDLRLLESALAMPRATFGGQRLHATLFEVAAAYLFYVTKNHAFVDGNKRTGIACALAFLLLNGQRIAASEDALYDLVVGVTEGRVTKAAAAVFFERCAEPLIRHRG